MRYSQNRAGKEKASRGRKQDEIKQSVTLRQIVILPWGYVGVAYQILTKETHSCRLECNAAKAATAELTGHPGPNQTRVVEGSRR
jgi:hypothetical protein